MDQLLDSEIEEPSFKNVGTYYVTQVEKAIKKILQLKPTEENIYSKFCKILLDTGSVIYNQLVINAISPFLEVSGTPYNPTILYIYATYSGAVAINDFIKTEMSEIIQASNQSVDVNYTKPFKHSIERNKSVKAILLYKNKRQSRLFLRIKIVNDIPSNVVLKEELSFQQILFDGKNVKATDSNDVINKVGNLNEEYLPLVGWNEYDSEDDEDEEPYAELSLKIYEKRNFLIEYDTKSIVIGYGYLYGKEVSGEEHLISYLHTNLVNILVNDRFKKMVDIDYGENTDITVADIYLRWFYLKEPTMNEFMKIIKRLANEGKFLLPLWVQDTYKKDDDIIKALVVHTCSLELYFIKEMYSGTKDTRKANEFAAQVIKDIKSDQKHDDVDFLKNPKIKALLKIIKKLILQKYIPLTSKYTYETDVELSRILFSQKDLLYTFFSEYRYDNKEIKTFAQKFLEDIGNYEDYQEIYNQYYQSFRKGSVEELVKIFKNYEQIANYEKHMSEKEDKERLKSNTRNIPALNIVKASRIYTADYDEKDRITGKKCTDVSNQSLYDMDKYLKGESVEAYTINGERYDDEDLEVVNPQEAMKRLIFFLAESTDLSRLNPYCYNLDRLTKDIGGILSVECKDFENYQGLEYLFGHNPIIRLDFEYAVYVPLSEILDAIYNTKKQVFILIPTEKMFRYTASLAVQFGTVGSRVSGDHCQEGSNKRLHTIKVCKGTKENVCWPVNEAIELNEVSPDIYYMKKKFYVWSKSENSMSAQFNIANQSYIDKVRERRQDEINHQRNMPRTPTEIQTYLTRMFSTDEEFPLIIDTVLDRIALQPVSSYNEADRIFAEVQDSEIHRRRVEREVRGDSPESPDTLRQLSNLTFGTDSDDEESIVPPDVQRQLEWSDDEENAE